MNNREYVIIDGNKLYISYKEKLVLVNIIYRKRKNISIKVTQKDKIDIISPRSITISYLKDLLANKIDWIYKVLDKFESIDEAFEDRNYIDGEIFYYLGDEYKLNIIRSKALNNKRKNCNIEIRGLNLVVRTNCYDKDYIKEQLKKWYKVQSENIVSNEIFKLKNSNKIMENLNPNTIKIKEQKKRWGSCTSAKKIYINSRISMANLEAIDYIIVHEFCHLVHMNHSKEFYKLVQGIMPDYKKSEKWLKEHGYKLVI